TCLIWHLSFEDGLVGAEVGLNANDLEGCYDLSNPISVFRNQPEGGTLEGGPFTFCVGDGEADMLEPGSITLSGNSGTNSAWVVTDDQGNILGLPPMPSVVDFDGAGPGTCLIWHLSFEDGLVGAEVGLNANDLEGCFSLSNPISVFRNEVQGGTLEGGPFTFCVGDGEADMLEPGSITLSGNSGTNSAWVVTDDQGNILGLPPMPSVVDFDGAGPGTCLIWHLSFEDGLVGAEVGLNANDLEGCFSLSNPISVFRNQPEGGTLEGGPFTFCVGDGVADMLEPGSITLSGNSGTNSAWVVTDDQGNILGLPPMPSVVDFDGAGPGTCLIWHLSFEDGLVGAEVGLNANDLEGCFSLSNPISVFRNQPEGGTLEGGVYNFCVGDGEADMIAPGSIVLTGNSGTNSAWVVTDDQGNILGLPPSPDVVDFDGAGVGVCLVWHLSFEDGLVGAEVGLNANDLEGCFSLSNPISVNRTEDCDDLCVINGGFLEGGPFEFCVGDGEADMLEAGSITLSGNSGTNSAWVVTDDQGNILGLPPMPSAVDFDGAGPGTCLVWHLSFEDGLEGAEVGMNAADLVGCYDLSNPIAVERIQPEGGTLEGGPFTFCVGDGEADMIEPGSITLSGNSGTNSAWVVTDDQGNILGLPPMPSVVDFDGAGPGTCLIWHLSFEDGLVGAEVGLNANDLQGCYSLSNPISVFRNQPAGGTLEGGPFTFCVSDGVADMLEPGSITLSGNSGTNSAWVVTDDQGNILGLPPMPSAVDFDGAGPGTCLVWHLSFEDGLEGAEVGMNANDLQGCFSLSNPIAVERIEVNGGAVTTAAGESEITITAGDGIDDIVEFATAGAVGANFTYVITDADNNILAVPEGNTANFEGAGPGVCRVWGLSYSGTLTADVGQNAGDVELSDGCFNLSDIFLTVNRVEGFQPNVPGSNAAADAPAAFNVQLYPNPSVDQLQVEIGTTNRTDIRDVEVLILQLDGKLRYRNIISSEQVRTTLDVSDLPAGSYLLRVNDGEQIVTKRFVKA
ncbi:MAG: T9SS type A sorting domain-containing protein, partial [Bacteroidota bacterium]